MIASQLHEISALPSIFWSSAMREMMCWATDRRTENTQGSCQTCSEMAQNEVLGHGELHHWHTAKLDIDRTLQKLPTGRTMMTFEYLYGSFFTTERQGSQYVVASPSPWREQIQCGPSTGD